MPKVRSLRNREAKGENTFSSRFYPADDVSKRAVRKKKQVTKLRKSITPGTVLILLAGVHRGKRVIFLKQLSSGLLLVTGPFKVNGVPLSRVNQAFVIASSTHVDVSGVNVDKFDDQYFSKPKAPRAKKNEEGFFQKQEEKKTVVVTEEQKQDQLAIDSSILAEISKVPQLKGYLRSRFTLSAHQYPHLMKF